MISTSKEVDRALEIMSINGKLALFYRLHDMSQMAWLRRGIGGIFKSEFQQMVRDALRSER